MEIRWLRFVGSAPLCAFLYWYRWKSGLDLVDGTPVVSCHQSIGPGYARIILDITWPTNKIHLQCGCGPRGMEKPTELGQVDFVDGNYRVQWANLGC
jgi:hypothetical protein